MKKNALSTFVLGLIPLLLTSCTGEPKALSLDHAKAYLSPEIIHSCPDDEQSVSFVSSEEKDLFHRYAPIFVIEDENIPYNKIGEPKLKRDLKNNIRGYVDFHTPKIYAQKREFITRKGHYTNLIYRVHFQKVPYGFKPFHVTAGKNGGQLVVVTLNDKKEPLFITTVDTCGCYISIIPTNYLPEDAYPKDWVHEPHYRYGEKHTPRICKYPKPFKSDYHPVIYMRTGNHRVSDVIVQNEEVIKAQYGIQEMNMVPITQLEYLQIDDEEERASFYYSDISKGMVRDAYKPYEMLFMSWVFFEPNVGWDKKYASSTEILSRFYTSLNPAYRRESDMWVFPRFLKFWGWSL